MNSFEKLKAKLAELFQLDQADLDFGIYRIMNARRDEIIRFLEQDLLPQVREAFAQYESADKTLIQAELDKVIDSVKAAGMDPEQSPKVKELRVRLATEALDLAALENEVYDHLCSFFGRYYDEGDFISLRRYKEGVYAIPYEGEEVKLHWANADQYYIKTAESFRDYTFRTPSGHRVHFKIAEADTEKDNIKAANGKDRRFLLHGDKPVTEEDRELVIRFEYRPDDEGRRQDAINAETVQRVIEDLNDDRLAVWQHRLSAKWHRADGTETDRTILEKRLDDYTKKNTFDYFIHKDLGGFLRRELDFYIKNEVMRLDDIEEESVPRVEQYLSKIRIVRRIAHKIIDFLAQIENFQKRLWLKKKFVVETNYCVTLDRVPEELYPEIAANDAQREEWVRLFAVDEIASDLTTHGYSEPMEAGFLKANQFLVLDTQFFSDEFKYQMLASMQDLWERTDGLLLNVDSFQGLNLLTPTYNEKIRCIYVDPPYNTGGDGFVYKDAYQHSTWLSMLADRIPLVERLIDRCGFLYCSVDDHECARCKLLLDAVLSSGQFVSDIAIVNNLKGRQDRAHIATAHEHLLFYAGADAKSCGLPLSAERLAKFDQKDDKGLLYELRDLRRRGGGDRRQDRPKMFFPIYWNKATKTASLTRRSEDEIEILPKRSDGSDGRWRWGPRRVQSNLSIIEARETPDGKKWNVYYRIYLLDED
jgi:adenine-specific DNA-methyltransferase